MSQQAVHDKGSEIPAGLNGLSSIDARRLLGKVGPNRWVKQDRFVRVREVLSLLLDPMAVMLIIAAVVYFLLGETRDAVVLALALIPVLGVDVLLEARSRAALDKLARAAAPSADVVRDGQVVSVPLEEVVPGDLLVLREGHVIAADAHLRRAPGAARRSPSNGFLRLLVFWTVWAASAVSLVLILYIPAAAQMFRVEHPPGVHVAVAIVLGCAGGRVAVAT